MGYLLFSCPVWAGADSSGGGDIRPPESGSAWFLGVSKSVRYCAQISKNFGTSRQFAEKAVEDAFQIWSDYIEEHRVHSTLYGEYRLALDFVPVRCDGTQDLTFYFGIRNNVIEAVRREYYNPVAFAHRVSYDAKRGWGNGFIWVAAAGTVEPQNSFPAWSDTEGAAKYHLKGQVLHEIGHVLGNDHIPDTIMREDFPELLRPGKPYTQLTRIDGTKALLLCSDNYCNAKYPGVVDGEDLNTQKGPSYGETFKRFVGRDPVGAVNAKLSFTSDPHTPPNVRVTIEDKAGSFEIPFMIRYDSAYTGVSYTIPSPIFKVVFIPPGASIPEVHAEHLIGGVIYGVVKTASGEEFMAVTELNMNGGLGPVSVKYFDKKGMKDLFLSLDFDLFKFDPRRAQLN